MGRYQFALRLPTEKNKNKKVTSVSISLPSHNLVRRTIKQQGYMGKYQFALPLPEENKKQEGYMGKYQFVLRLPTEKNKNKKVTSVSISLPSHNLVRRTIKQQGYMGKYQFALQLPEENKKQEGYMGK